MDFSFTDRAGGIRRTSVGRVRSSRRGNASGMRRGGISVFEAGTGGRRRHPHVRIRQDPPESDPTAARFLFRIESRSRNHTSADTSVPSGIRMIFGFPELDDRDATISMKSSGLRISFRLDLHFSRRCRAARVRVNSLSLRMNAPPSSPSRSAIRPSIVILGSTKSGPSIRRLPYCR